MKSEDVFMSIDELCTPKTLVHQKFTSVIREKKRNEAMERLIRELIGDRLLELRRYVILDYASKIMHVEKSYLKTMVSVTNTLIRLSQFYLTISGV